MEDINANIRHSKIFIPQISEDDGIDENILTTQRSVSKMSKEDREKEPVNRFIILLKLTGLYFGNRNKENFWYYRENFWFYMGMLRAFLFCALAIYQSIIMIYKLFMISPPQEKMAFTLFMASFMVQSTLAMIFLIYWQLSGHLNQLLDIVRWPALDELPSTHRKIKITFAICIFFMFIMFSYIGFTAYMLAMSQMEYILIDDAFFDIFGKDQYRYFALFVSYLAGNTWLIVLIFYVVISIILHGKFHHFNEDLNKIGDYDEDEWPVQEQLLENYNEHIKMSIMVKTVDNMFEVYTFFMIGLNIPTTIFGLISVFSLPNPSHKNLFLVLPAPFMCTLQLLGLTAIPARVHTAIREVKNILYANTRIWRPYNEQIYQIASVFISHVDQANLGYSVWGFAIVTKPLILTTVSITITYLTILIQLKEQHEINNFGRVCPCNLTAPF